MQSMGGDQGQVAGQGSAAAQGQTATQAQTVPQSKIGSAAPASAPMQLATPTKDVQHSQQTTVAASTSAKKGKKGQKKVSKKGTNIESKEGTVQSVSKASAVDAAKSGVKSKRTKKTAPKNVEGIVKPDSSSAQQKVPIVIEPSGQIDVSGIEAARAQPQVMVSSQATSAAVQSQIVSPVSAPPTVSVQSRGIAMLAPIQAAAVQAASMLTATTTQTAAVQPHTIVPVVPVATVAPQTHTIVAGGATGIIQVPDPRMFPPGQQPGGMQGQLLVQQPMIPVGSQQHFASQLQNIGQTGYPVTQASYLPQVPTVVQPTGAVPQMINPIQQGIVTVPGTLQVSTGTVIPPGSQIPPPSPDDTPMDTTPGEFATQLPYPTWLIQESADMQRRQAAVAAAAAAAAAQAQAHAQAQAVQQQSGVQMIPPVQAVGTTPTLSVQSQISTATAQQSFQDNDSQGQVSVAASVSTAPQQPPQIATAVQSSSVRQQVAGSVIQTSQAEAATPAQLPPVVQGAQLSTSAQQNVDTVQAVHPTPPAQQQVQSSASVQPSTSAQPYVPNVSTDEAAAHVEQQGSISGPSPTEAEIKAKLKRVELVAQKITGTLPPKSSTSMKHHYKPYSSWPERLTKSRRDRNVKSLR